MKKHVILSDLFDPSDSRASKCDPHKLGKWNGV